MMSTAKATPVVPERGFPRSLRLRLMCWYGALLAIALGCFAGLFLVLTTSAINQGVKSAVQAQARVASLALHRKLSLTSPYWPPQLALPAIDTFRGPGVVVEIVDAQGQVRYLSAKEATVSIPVSGARLRSVFADQSPTWYTTTVVGEPVRVEVLPIGAPLVDASGNVEQATLNADGTLANVGPPIGALLVAKSLSDVDATLFQLQALLLLSGLVTLAGTLAVSWILATRVLHPLSGIVATAHAIVASTASGTRLGPLHQRVPRPGGRDELAQVVDTFNEMLDSLERATQAQRRFVADASHELRAPLTIMQGNIAFLQHHLDTLPPEERHAMLADASRETVQLAQLVEALLLLARADANVDSSMQGDGTLIAGKGSTQRQLPVELDHALLQLVRQLRRRLSVEGSKVQLELGRIEPVRVCGEEESLRRVALILLDNALKYTPGSGEDRKGRVIVSLERRDGQAVLRVRDTGIGIEPADLPHIFERFYRADRSRSRQGTGLGLAIAQAEVERLDGHITAESSPGQGSSFSVWLPLA
jgi:two-component system OmpR family sensor kinase